MMQIDRTRGCLRIDGRTLTGLLARLDDQVQGRVPGEDAGLFDVDEARAAGVLEGTRFASDIAPLVDTIAAPWGELALTVVHDRVDDEHRVWLGPRTAVAALSVGDGHYDLGGLAPTAVPAFLWRIARLGARDRRDPLPGPVAVAEDDVRALVADGDGRPLAAALGQGPLAEALTAGRLRLVTLHVEWSGALNGGSPLSEALSLLDTAAGIVALELDDAGVLVRPTTPAALWPRLVAMTRPPAELDLDGPYARATSTELDLEVS